MIRIGIHMKIFTSVTMVLMCLNITEINGESSGGFRGNVVETIRMSRHKIVHTIAVKVNGQVMVSLQYSSFQNQHISQKNYIKLTIFYF